MTARGQVVRIAAWLLIASCSANTGSGGAGGGPGGGSATGGGAATGGGTASGGGTGGGSATGGGNAAGGGSAGSGGAGGATADAGVDVCNGKLCVGAVNSGVSFTYNCTGPCVGSGSNIVEKPVNPCYFGYGTATNPVGGQLICSAGFESPPNTPRVSRLTVGGFNKVGIPTRRYLPEAYAWCESPVPPGGNEKMSANVELSFEDISVSCTAPGGTVATPFKLSIYGAMNGDGGAIRCGYLCTECDQRDPVTNQPVAAFGGSFKCEQDLTSTNVLTGVWSALAYKGTKCTFKGGFHVGGMPGTSCK